MYRLYQVIITSNQSSYSYQRIADSKLSLLKRLDNPFTNAPIKIQIKPTNYTFRKSGDGAYFYK